MKKMYLFLLCLVLGPGSVFASPVPGIDAESSEFLPPPIDGDLPVQPPSKPPSPSEELDFSYASGLLYSTIN
jgi:hypothetical protein